MEFKKRKNPRLYGYDYNTPGAYFITICTKDRKCLLSKIVGDDDLGVPQNRLTKMGKFVQKCIHSSENINDVKVDKYVIMPNHIHLILLVNEKCVGADDLGCPSENPVSMGGFSELLDNRVFGASNPKNTDGTPGSSSPTNAAIPRYVGALKRFINKEVGQNIFQRSYHDHIIRNEKDYLRIWEYIENNPKKWELDCFYTEETECI